MKDYTHVLYFNGCPKFYGTLDECEAELSKEATTARMRRFYSIRTRKSVEEKAAIKMIDSQSKVKMHSSPGYDRFGDVVYYN